MRTTCVRRPARCASSRTCPSVAGWLRRSASTFASRGTATASHCVARPRALASSARICAALLVA
eukprot:917898-Pleurochrysis_carterae.AAC.1